MSSQRVKSFLRMACCLVAAFLAAGCAQAAVTSVNWGTTPEGRARLFTLTTPQLKVELCEYGARIVSIEAPDKNGRRADVVLGYNNLKQYVDDPKDFFGAVVGRYGNRIAKGTFLLDGKTYNVPVNNKGNALHGGTRGFSSRLWKGRAIGNDAVEFTLTSADGDMGFPGTLTVRVRYTLRANRLRLDYSAKTDKPTVLNLTNHTYFNLAGEASGTILQQKVRLRADRFTPIDDTLIPTGKLLPVAGTAMDLRQLTPIGAKIHASFEQLQLAGGYDHNFVVNGPVGILREAAYAADPRSGRTLTVLTTEPGVQFYSGNFLSGQNHGYSGIPYKKNDGFCFETQHFPDSPNRPGFPSTVLRPGKTFHSSTQFIFGTL